MIAEQLEAMIVSHAPTRGLTGAFHRDKNYALHIPEPDSHQLAIRFLIDEKLTLAQAQKVIDPELRDQLVARLTSGPPSQRKNPLFSGEKREVKRFVTQGL